MVHILHVGQWLNMISTRRMNRVGLFGLAVMEKLFSLQQGDLSTLNYKNIASRY